MSGIRGLGIDIEEVDRITRLIDLHGERFTTRVFTAGEIAYCEGRALPAQHYTARFAAKEALSKAIGTGWRGAFRWQDAEVLRNAAGSPSFRLHHDLAEALAGCRVHLSLSHIATHATAVVIVEDA
jgi:holo-[acyl-carrier protein] synthase